jgi:hypothetical protein
VASTSSRVSSEILRVRSRFSWRTLPGTRQVSCEASAPDRLNIDGGPVHTRGATGVSRAVSAACAAQCLGLLAPADRRFGSPGVFTEFPRSIGPHWRRRALEYQRNSTL